MITTDNMYTSYNHHICVEIVTIDNELKNLNDSLVYINSILKQIENTPDQTIYHKALLKNYSLIKNNTTKRIDGLEKRRNYLREGKVNCEEYKFIARLFNKLITKHIIDTGYKLKISELGTIRIKSVRKIDNVRRRINWGLSNKIKKSIEDKGGTPFKAEYEIVNGKKVKINDNGGEMWLVKHDTPYEILWYWEKLSSCHIFNQSLYKLSFTKHMKLAINTAAKENPSMFVRFI